MLNISGYLGPSSEIPIVDDRAPIVISSCGHFRLSREEYLITSRPAGRPDYQLLYIAGGTAHFWLKEKERVLPEGHTVLYRPGESWALAANPSARWGNISNTPVCLSK